MVRLQGEQAADARQRQRNPGGPLPFFTLNPKFIVQREKGEKMKFSKAILTVLALLIFSVSGALMAQPSRAGQEIQGQPEGAVVGDSKPASRLPTDEDLISFAQAYRKVVQIRKRLVPGLKIYKTMLRKSNSRRKPDRRCERPLPEPDSPSSASTRSFKNWIPIPICAKDWSLCCRKGRIQIVRKSKAEQNADPI